MKVAFEYTLKNRPQQAQIGKFSRLKRRMVVTITTLWLRPHYKLWVIVIAGLCCGHDHTECMLKIVTVGEAVVATMVVKPRKNSIFLKKGKKV